MNATKEYILKTSLILFLQKSYRDVTMKEIVEKTGLSKGAFYHYFNSKEELFKEIAYMFFSMGNVDYSIFNQNSLSEFYQQYAEYLDKSFISLSELSKDSSEGNSSFNFFLILFEAISRFPEFLDMELEMHIKDVEAWKVVIANARKNDEIKTASSDEEIASLFLYCNDGAFIRYLNNNSASSFKKVLLQAYDTIYQNLKI